MSETDTFDISEVLDRMLRGSVASIQELTETMGVTLGEISDWIAHPHSRHTIANLVTLFDAQSQLMICRQRMLAVAKLTEVCATATAPETIRRACKDLLTIRLIDPYKEDKRPEKPTPPPRVSEEKILAALEELCPHDGYDPPVPSEDALSAHVPPRPPADWPKFGGEAYRSIDRARNASARFQDLGASDRGESLRAEANHAARDNQESNDECDAERSVWRAQPCICGLVRCDCECGRGPPREDSG